MKLWIDEDFDKFDREKLTPWLSIRSSGFAIKRPDGSNGWSYSMVDFEGNPRDQFWGNFIKTHLMDVIDRSFEKTRDLCERYKKDCREPFRATSNLQQRWLSRALARMVEIDRRLRGKGFPGNISTYHPQEEEKYLTKIIEERFSAEVTPLNPILEWLKNHPYSAFVSLGLTVLALILKLFGLD